MFLTREPAEAEVRAFVAAQSTLPFSYADVGATREGVLPPKGYVADRYRVKLSEGEEAYRRAVEALRGWRQFDLGWVSIVPRGAPLKVGTTVAVLARHYGFWSLNSARVVYLVEGTDRAERFGFAYGTLPGHGEKGEERFVVERDRESGAVHYDVLAFSRPNHPLAWLGYPFARALQRRFARDSKVAMARATNPGG
ncbi:MAG TPA: DUF1990 domain-containing protein [Rubrobacteraceae bacterium]|nr:DUF1990 domain-containing protein [Rubrobacteraceae bacterium]